VLHGVHDITVKAKVNYYLSILMLILSSRPQSPDAWSPTLTSDSVTFEVERRWKVR